jgi:hypothetical protein
LSPITSSACAAASCGESGARKGPDGTTLPLPTPRVPSTTRNDRSLRSVGFWKPSSMTITVAPSP